MQKLIQIFQISRFFLFVWQNTTEIIDKALVEDYPQTDSATLCVLIPQQMS